MTDSTVAAVPAPVTEAAVASSGARQQMMYDANRKSAGVAYLLLIFLGGLGAHRFYMGKSGTAIAQLCLTLLGWLTVMIGIGLVMLAAVGIWIFVDLFLIPAIVRDRNMRLADAITGH